ncbi:MAG: deoxyribonuclease IV [Candidatus Omnitrophica bacterium]|nr:deoxyribonuclease IV [Candidatus Omnitrophota bacterium]
MKLGIHTSIAGKIYESVDRAAGLGCNTMQIFSRNPRGWQVSGLIKADVEEFKRRRKKEGISPLLVHIPYLINLATPDDLLYKKSIAAYIEDIKRADQLGSEYFVTHLGSHMGSGIDNGIKRFSAAINTIIAKANPKVMILLENTAGSGSSLGNQFEHIRDIIKRITKKKQIGVCFDTAHAYAAGFDIKTAKGLDKTLKVFNRLIGLKRLKAVHLNDSKADLGSHVDRHENIGKGKLGVTGIKSIINHPSLRDLPFILETPQKRPEDDRVDLRRTRKLYK